MDFTREPIIETIITPKDGHKLVVRSSKNTGQEEYFVDALEVVTLGNNCFYRSIEKPKAFLVPVSDYEVVEVRESRMVLKHMGAGEKAIKIGGGREGVIRATKEKETEREEAAVAAEEQVAEQVEQIRPGEGERPVEAKLDKKRDRRRHYRKRKGGREEGVKEEAPEIAVPPLETEEKITIPAPEAIPEEEKESALPASVLSSLLQPPPLLISETIGRYRENVLFKNAFFSEEEGYKPHNKAQELLNEDEIESEKPQQEEQKNEEESSSFDIEEEEFTLPLFTEEEEEASTSFFEEEADSEETKPSNNL